MEYILETKENNETTRIFFGYSVSLKTLKNLYDCFLIEGMTFNIIQADKLTLKLLNSAERNSIEITSEYISFFPKLNEEDKKEVKKRIYNIVARRSEVYFKSSSENLEAAKISLLKSDFRSSTSLMYYSLHKFMSGRYYKMINEKLKVSDLDIQVSDVGHYTSELLYAIHEKVDEPINKLTKENYIDLLRIGKRKKLNPFLIARHDLDEKSFSSEPLDSLIDNVCEALFGGKLEDLTIDFFVEFINEFNNTPKKKRDQDFQVKATIAFCFQKIKESNRLFHKFNVLALRIYWLRQNADYDYDFEIKVSVRELCLIFSSVKSVCKNLSEFEKDEEEKEVIDPHKSQNILKDKNLLMDLETEPSLIEVEKNQEYYRVEYNVNTKVTGNSANCYMICLHLDSTFNHYNSLFILNMMNEITNAGKYFAFENESLPFYINLHISDEGKWTFWIPSMLDEFEIRKEEDLINSVEVFFKKYREAAETIFSDFKITLLQAFPMMNEKYNDIFSLKSYQNEIIRKDYISNHYSHQVLNLYASLFKKNFFYSQQKNVEFIFDIKFYNKNHISLEIPLNKLMEKRVLPKEVMYVFICFYVYSNQSDEDDVIKRSISLKDMVFETMDQIDEKFINIEYIPINSTEFDEFVRLKKVSEQLKSRLIELTNDLLYDFVERENFETAKLFFDNLPDSVLEQSSYLLATKGMYYFRNEDFSNHESFELGQKLYDDAIKLVSQDEKDFEYAFRLKFSLEKTKFMLSRENNIDLAIKEIEVFDSIPILDDEDWTAEKILNEMSELKQIIAKKSKEELSEEQ